MELPFMYMCLVFVQLIIVVYRRNERLNRSNYPDTLMYNSFKIFAINGNFNKLNK